MEPQAIQQLFEQALSEARRAAVADPEADHDDAVADWRCEVDLDGVICQLDGSFFVKPVAMLPNSAKALHMRCACRVSLWSEDGSVDYALETEDFAFSEGFGAARDSVGLALAAFRKAMKAACEEACSRAEFLAASESRELNAAVGPAPSSKSPRI